MIHLKNFQKFLFVIITTASLNILNSQNCTDCLPHTDPKNIGNWQLQEKFSDEFNDQNISSNWHKQGANNNYFNGWRGRSPSQFVPQNIVENNKSLKILTKWEPDFDFYNGNEAGVIYGSVPLTTGALISKEYLQYGYIEIRCKVGKSPMSGAFWGVDSSNNGELDVFEHVGMAWDKQKNNEDIPTIMHSSFHSWKLNRPEGNNRVFQHKHKLDFDVTDDFHIYAADWTADYVKFYVDGRLVREIKKSDAQKIEFGPTNGWVVNTPMRLWLDAEIFPWEGRISELKEEMFGNDKSFFEVDYVRVWKRGNNGNIKNNEHGPNLVKNGNFSSNLNNWNIIGTSYRPDISSWKFWKDNNPSEDNFCLQLGGGATIAKQTITVKPNTRYMLTAFMRMPSTTATVQPPVNTKIFHNGYYGVKNFNGNQKIEKKIFLNHFHGYSIEFKTGTTNTEATIFFDNKTSGNPMHIDEISLVEMKNLNKVNSTNEQLFYIQNKASGKKIRPTSDATGSLIKQVSNNYTGKWVKWSKIKTDGEWFHLKNLKTNKFLRPKLANGNDGTYIELVSKSANGAWTQWKLETANNGYSYLVNRGSSKHIRPVSGNENSLIELRPNSWKGNWTQWKLTPINNSKKESSRVSLNRKSKKIILYPNPSNGSITLDFPKDFFNKSLAIEILNLNGQVVFKKFIMGNKLQLNTQLSKGIYFINIKNDKTLLNQKIIIN